MYWNQWKFYTAFHTWNYEHIYEHLMSNSNFVWLAVLRPSQQHEPGHEKTCLCNMRSKKGAVQPAHLRSLISTFVVHYLVSIIPILAKSKISSLQVASVAEQAGCKPRSQVFLWCGSYCNHLEPFDVKFVHIDSISLTGGFPAQSTILQSCWAWMLSWLPDGWDFLLLFWFFTLAVKITELILSQVNR